jgi:hypothetical protein
MLCNIWGFHGGDYEECRLLGYNDALWLLLLHGYGAVSHGKDKARGTMVGSDTMRVRFPTRPLCFPIAPILPSSRITVLGPTPPLTELNTRNLLGANGRRCVRLTTSPPSVRDLDVSERYGPLQTVRGKALPFVTTSRNWLLPTAMFLSRAERWGWEHLGLRERKWEKVGLNCLKRTSVIVVCLIICTWWKQVRHLARIGETRNE